MKSPWKLPSLVAIATVFASLALVATETGCDFYLGDEIDPAPSSPAAPLDDAGPSAPVTSTTDPTNPTPSPSGGDGGPSPTAGKVPMFVGQGYLGRTIVSCDDGKTWVGNHAWDTDGDPMVCGMKQDKRCGDTCSYSVQ